MNLKLVIFDMDGLMFDTEQLFMKFLIETAKEHGYNFTRELYLKTIGTNGANLQNILYSELGTKYPYIEISMEAQKKMSSYTDTFSLPVKEGLFDLLDYLKSKNIPCCVASSTKSEIVKHYLDIAGVLDYFGYIAGGEMVTQSKPDPEIFLLACNHYDVSPCNALVLEDSKNGIKAACAASIPVICVPDLIKPDNYMVNTALKICNTLRDVIPLLE